MKKTNGIVIATIRTGHDYKEECRKLAMGYEAVETEIDLSMLWARAADELGI